MPFREKITPTKETGNNLNTRGLSLHWFVLIPLKVNTRLERFWFSDLETPGNYIEVDLVRLNRDELMKFESTQLSSLNENTKLSDNL